MVRSRHSTVCRVFSNFVDAVVTADEALFYGGSGFMVNITNIFTGRPLIFISSRLVCESGK